MKIYTQNIQNNNKRVNFFAKPIKIETAQSLVDSLCKANSIDIFVHSSPDEDTYNSAKVLYRFLKGLGKKVRICSERYDLGELYNRPFEKYKLKKNVSEESNLAVWVDFNGWERITDKQKAFLKSQTAEKIMVLDHHDLSKTTIIDKTNTEKNYVDNTAKSCCGVLVRLFDALNVKLKKNQLKDLFCGMLSDYRKSGLIKIDSENGKKLIRCDKLSNDKNSEEVLNILEERLSEKSKQKVLNHLDILSHLTNKERNFAKGLPSKVKITPNGKLAYIAIDYNDTDWAAIGMDNIRTSLILSEMRKNIINSAETKNIFTEEQKEKLKNIEGAMVFYRKNAEPGSDYKISIHSHNGYAGKLIDFVKNIFGSSGAGNIDLGGHPNRIGGKLHSPDNDKIQNFINSFVEAAQNS